MLNVLKEKAYNTKRTKAIFTVWGDGHGPGGRLADLGIFLDGVEVEQPLKRQLCMCDALRIDRRTQA